MDAPADGAGVECVGGDGDGAEAATVDHGEGGGQVDASPAGASVGDLVGATPRGSSVYELDLSCCHTMGYGHFIQEHREVV